MAKKENRIVITLSCTECKGRTYTTEKNRKNDAGRIELMKYCPVCRKHTEHREQR
ncbi:MAG: 50S ribosomal protein L33 [Chloroflexi bacterium]|jgi:large subunit ribosomal protein L33|nr:50S ribosomal protein L33 [Chloroflexota bacterium]